MTNEEIARVFKAFCDERRITILKSLAEGEKCACVLLEELEISQPTLSHHMKILTASKVVEARRDGKWIHYHINSKEASKVVDILQSLMVAPFPENSTCCCTKEKEQ